MPREFSRKLRVGAELQRLLNELLYAEVKDPRLAGVTVNEVEVSGDLGVAKVYFGTLDPNLDPQDARAGFDKAGGFLRLRIGQSLRLRRVPELHFVHDLSAQRGLELSRLIDEAAQREDLSNGVDSDDQADAGATGADDFGDNDLAEHPGDDFVDDAGGDGFGDEDGDGLGDDDEDGDGLGDDDEDGGFGDRRGDDSNRD
jgi:ribosome-binding factor A